MDIKNKSDMYLSVVIPVYNDQEVLPELYARLKPVLDSIHEAYEVILVDDGSKDKSWHEITEICNRDNKFVGIKLSRNFGQQNSISAGLDHTRGEIIVLMDSDLQDRPEDIPLLIDSLIKHNVSMAIAQWTHREDSSFKKSVSNLFFHVSDKITDIHIKPRLGIFRAMRKCIIDELKNFPEKTSTTISLLYYIGNNYVCVPLKRDARFAGVSGYNLSKMLSLTFTRIFSFSMFPIRLAIYTGFILSILSFLWGIYLITSYLLGNIVAGSASIITAVAFLFGLNFIFIGILGEYLGKVFLETKQRPKYIVSEIKVALS